MCCIFVFVVHGVIVCLVIGTLSVSSSALRLSSRWDFVCLVSSFRYNSLAALALAAFVRVRALRAPLQALLARCGPALKVGGLQAAGGTSLPINNAQGVRVTYCTSAFLLSYT